jgi:hypothetical protein
MVDWLQTASKEQIIDRLRERPTFWDWLETASKDQIIDHLREQLQAIRDCASSVDDKGNFDDPDFLERADGALWTIFETAPELWNCFYTLVERATTGSGPADRDDEY